MTQIQFMMTWWGCFSQSGPKRFSKSEPIFFFNFKCSLGKKNPDEFGPNMQKGEKKKIQDQQFFYDDEDIG